MSGRISGDASSDFSMSPRAQSYQEEQVYSPNERRGSQGSRRRAFSLLNRRSASNHSTHARTIGTPSVDDLHTGKAFSFDRFMAKSQSMQMIETHATAPANFDDHHHAASTRKTLPGRLLDLSPLRIANLTLPFGAKSSDGIFRHRKSVSDRHYFFSEIQFVGALVDISRRLCRVPRPGRQSALKAELALLNHNLPARVCIPLWCSATDAHPYHHQVVRICPDEAVVLNSAEKV